MHRPEFWHHMVALGSQLCGLLVSQSIGNGLEGKAGRGHQEQVGRPWVCQSFKNLGGWKRIIHSECPLGRDKVVAL